MNDEQKGSHLVEQHLMYQTLQGNVTHKTWTLRNETIMHGHDRHNTTTYIVNYTKHVNYMFRPILFLAIIRLDTIIGKNTIYMIQYNY